jgi:hypothetical protein
MTMLYPVSLVRGCRQKQSTLMMYMAPAVARPQTVRWRWSCWLIIRGENDNAVHIRSSVAVYRNKTLLTMYMAPAVARPKTVLWRRRCCSLISDLQPQKNYANMDKLETIRQTTFRTWRMLYITIYAREGFFKASLLRT